MIEATTLSVSFWSISITDVIVGIGTFAAVYYAHRANKSASLSLELLIPEWTVVPGNANSRLFAVSVTIRNLGRRAFISMGILDNGPQSPLRQPLLLDCVKAEGGLFEVVLGDDKRLPIEHGSSIVLYSRPLSVDEAEDLPISAATNLAIYTACGKGLNRAITPLCNEHAYKLEQMGE